MITFGIDGMMMSVLLIRATASWKCDAAEGLAYEPKRIALWQGLDGNK
jgi:hypothetical protein